MRFLDWFKNAVAGWDAKQSPTEWLAETDDDNDLDPFDPFPEPVSIEITDIIDLHTMPPRDVKRVVEEYLGEARRAGFRSVRIIHGKGIGVQREMVRSILARTPFVEDWIDAPPEAGGLGATIVRLSGAESTDYADYTD
jgi:hypothetical protein